MIISCVKDDTLGRAVRIVASPDEDIFQIDAGNAGVGRRGFPRLLIRETGQPTFETPKLAWSHDAEIPTVTITAGTLARVEGVGDMDDVFSRVTLALSQ